jgi:hypothetical protein
MKFRPKLLSHPAHITLLLSLIPSIALAGSPHPSTSNTWNTIKHTQVGTQVRMGYNAVKAGTDKSRSNFSLSDRYKIEQASEGVKRTLGGSLETQRTKVYDVLRTKRKLAPKNAEKKG